MYGMFRMSIEVSCVCTSVYSTKDASWIVSGGSFQKPVMGTPTNSDTDYILSILYKYTWLSDILNIHIQYLVVILFSLPHKNRDYLGIICNWRLFLITKIHCNYHRFQFPAIIIASLVPIICTFYYFWWQ